MINKIKVLAIIFCGLLALVLLYFLLNLYPNFLWFSSFGFGLTWWIVFKAKLFVFFGFFILAFAFMSVNAILAQLFSAKESAIQEVNHENKFHSALAQLFGVNDFSRINNVLGQSKKVYDWLLQFIIFVFAVLFGLSAKNSWQIIFANFNKTNFNIKAPIFGNDLSFYVFQIPFFKFIYSWATGLLIITIGIIAVIYLSNNIFSLIFKPQSRTLAKKHIFLLIGIFFLTLAFGQWIGLYEILFSNRGVVYGAGYADNWAQLLGNKAVLGTLIIASFSFIIWAFRPGALIPIYSIGLFFLIKIILSGIYPSLIQSYLVAPNELEKEKIYIEHNIAFTRLGYNLNNIEEVEFPVKYNLTFQDIKNNPMSIKNIRLWGPGPLKQTFGQLQEIRPYYSFLDVDVDRYKIGDNVRQVMLSVRELEKKKISAQAQTWVNQHLIYTHGYGLCLSPVNEITGEGMPNFFVKDFPPTSSVGIKITRPEIYFGEQPDTYVLVNTKQPEFNYPQGDINAYINYPDKGGIVLDSVIKKGLFAIKFSDIKILISPQITKESRILYDRDIRTIVNKIAPFLVFDKDAYAVITNSGRIVWMLDAYTISKYFPYSEPFQKNLNYIRNSVKITIDACSGETNFYVVDVTDPIIMTYVKIYPGLFKAFSGMPADLKEHIRYPEDLFTLQAMMYRTYHMTEPQVFYNREDSWNIAQERFNGAEQNMEAYYINTKLPKETKENFILMIPFTPKNKNNMISWLSAKCDLAEYGKLKVYKFPKERTIYGPMQIEARIDQDTEISQKLTLWGQVGSSVIRGNLMVIPIEESLIYVEPIYLQATQGKLPEFKRVIFSYNDSVIMRETLDQAIEATFGLEKEVPDEDKDIFESKGKNVTEIVKQVQQQFNDFRDKTIRKINELNQLLEQLK